MILAVDSETTGTDFFHGCRPFLVTMCDGEDNYYFHGDVNPYTREVYWDDDVLYEIQQLLDSCTTLIFHNTQFDMRALESIGIKIHHLWTKIQDTLLASHLLCSGDSHNLKDLSIKYLRYWDDDETEMEIAVKAARTSAGAKGWAIAKKGHPHFPALQGAVTWWKMDMWLAPEECLKYALCDAERTWLLWDAFRYGIAAEALWEPYKLRKQLLKICYDITTTGLRLNLGEVRRYIQKLKEDMQEYRLAIEEELDVNFKFNWNKKDHLIHLIHKKLDIPILERTETGQPSTSKKTLKEYHRLHDEPLLNMLMAGRKLDTELRYVQSYYNWTDEEGVIHSSLNITGTRETRQSSTSPNQQNITATLKELFEPPPGYIWVEVDFANIELRIWAFAVRNEELMQAFNSDQSVHMLIMDELYPREANAYRENPSNKMLANLYRMVKAGNFAIIYGATERKADETYGFVGATAKIYRRFPGVQEYTQKLIQQCEENRKCFKRHAVFTLGGYLLDVPSDEPFKACNFYAQGSAGIVMNKAMIAVTKNERYIDSGSQLVSQVHDSITPQISIHKGIEKTVNSIVYSMEHCAMDIFGRTPVDFKVKYHPNDHDNPHLQSLINIPF